MTTGKYGGLEIAIIGISAQFPESEGYREYWENLAAGRELLKFFTKEELRAADVPDSLLQHEYFVPSVGGMIDHKDRFDHAFFGYTAEEASFMDPQIRILHQHCWSALEDAGHAAAIERKKIGLFAGASMNTNWKIHTYTRPQSTAIDPLYLNMITSNSFIATLVSYKLNLRGPAVFVDSACSTSLVAVHLACRSLLTRECSLALAGGVSIRTDKKRGYVYQEGKVISRDGHCRAFDATASGTAVGEGVGIVVLKRLNEAIKDGDHIYAIIRATALNNDGSHKAGYTTPSVKGQAECITMAHKLANIQPGSITYVEAHGTGTRLGDPVELRALNEAFGTGGNEKFCALGSVKTNIGHLDTAAGVAGLIKTALCLKHRQLPASLHFREANPEIDFSGGPFYVNTELKEWKRKGDDPLRAGVSSFGIGGTNAHAILEEAPPQEALPEGRRFKLLTVSARTAQSVSRYLEKLQLFIEQNPEVNLSDMCYTLQTGRKEFSYRQTAVFSDRTGLLELLGSGRLQETVSRPAERTVVVFMFPGQGSQYSSMGRDLYENEAVFRQQMDAGFTLLRALTGEDFKAVLFEEGGSRINDTRYAQPLLFLFEYSLSKLLGSMGITPQYMIGHSIGEYVAACVSGVFSFEDGLRLVIKRGELMSSVEGGSMLSVGITEQSALPYINGGTWLSGVNGPQQVVLSGSHTAIGRLKSKLDADGVVYSPLHTSHAFHSGMQEGILEDYGKAVREVQLSKGSIPFISNVSGELIREEESGSASYWVRQLRQPVQLSKGFQRLLSQEKGLVFIECGAGHTLSSLLRQHGAGVSGVSLVRGVREQEDDVQYLLGRVGQLWSQGLSIDWAGYYGEERRRKISLPTYSFDPVRYATEVDPFAGGLMAGLGVQGVHTNAELKDWLYYPGWKRALEGEVLEDEQKQEEQGEGQDQEQEKDNDRLYLCFVGAGFSAGSLQLDGTVIEVRNAHDGPDRSKLSDQSYSIDATAAADYDWLVESLNRDGKQVTDIIYGWGIAAGRLKLSAENRDLHLCYFGLVWLVQSLLRVGMLSERRIVVLTDRLHKVIGTETVRYEQSLLLGLVNVLPQEYSVRCRNVDISLEEQETIRNITLSRELNNTRQPAERIIALRHGQYWKQSFEKNKKRVERSSGVLRKGGLYLVTGGLGNVGYVLSRYLLEKYEARLVLTGRTEPAALSGHSLEHYQSLCAMSEQVHYYNADVCDEPHFTACVEECEQLYGRVDGVIHTAGIINERYFELTEDITMDNSLKLMGAKVEGIEHLYRVFADRRPDFVWISSSLSTVLGGLGFGSYAAANLYMDYFLQSKSGELNNWHAVGLGGMAFSRQEIAREEGVSRSVLKPEELALLFDWSLGLTGSPVIIQTIEDLGARMHRIYEVRKDSYLDAEGASEDGAGNGAAVSKLERPGLSTAYTAPQTATERKLVLLFENFFCIAGIGTEDNFFELGGDSLKAMMLLKRIKNEFDINITLTDFLTNTDISSMALKVDEHLWLNSSAIMNNEMVI